MKSVSISGSPRVNVGKKDAKATRKQNLVPCVFYGGKEQIYFTTAEDNFKNIVYTPEICTVKLEINNKEYNAILQDIQFHPVTDKILHVDFLEIFDNKAITMNVPIKVTGTAPGIIKGGKLLMKAKKLKVKALPKYMPDNITIDISKLDIGDNIRVSGINVKDATILDAPNNIVVTVRITRVVVEEKPAEVTTAAATTAAPAATTAAPVAEVAKEKAPAKGKK